MKRILIFLTALIMLALPMTCFAASGELTIDSDTKYPGMNKTYADGYIPTVKDGVATIVLPLKGAQSEVTVTADLGIAEGSPFVFGNYSKTVPAGEPCVFTFDIPLAEGRVNGAYPVNLNAAYTDESGMPAMKTFTVYVTVKDGKAPIDPNAAPEKETIEKPELFIETCEVISAAVGGNEEFTVRATVRNIGNLRARNIRLTYGGAPAEDGSTHILPAELNNALHLENIGASKSTDVEFRMRTTPDITSGSKPFYITLDYADAYGGEYSSNRTFLVTVSQPSAFEQDDILPLVPKSVAAGETFSLPANVYNTGKSTLRNVMVTVTGAGLFPTSAAFLGDIAPGTAGNGEISVFVGKISMTEGFSGDYGQTSAAYTVTYTDDAGEEHSSSVDFTTEILPPVIETPEEDPTLAEQPAFQWWIMLLVGFAIIAVIVSAIVVGKVLRNVKMGK